MDYLSLENELRWMADSRIACNLTTAQKRELADLSIKLAGDAENFEGDMKLPLGISVATSAERNYLFALLTANAVVEHRIRTGNGAHVVELGCGSGINAIAAMLVDPDARVAGYEQSEHSYRFARKQADKFGVGDRIDLFLEDFTKVDFGRHFDVVVNENLNPSLVAEPLFPAIDSVVPYTHAGTLWVPSGLEIYLRRLEPPYDTPGKEFRIGSLDLNKTIRSTHIVSREFQPEEVEGANVLRLLYGLKDFNGHLALFPWRTKDPGGLPLHGGRVYLTDASRPFLMQVEIDPYGNDDTEPAVYIDQLQVDRPKDSLPSFR